MTQWGLDTLFNPGKRHMDEEKRRLQSTRQQIGDSSGGQRIDLESGKVTIRRPGVTGNDMDAAGDSTGAPLAEAESTESGSLDTAVEASPEPAQAPEPAEASPERAEAG